MTTTPEPNVSPASREMRIWMARGPRVPIDFTHARELYERLLAESARNRRSFTAECLVRLERSLRS